MLNIALFGPPGAGKGTQSQLLIDKYKLFYISTGDLLAMLAHIASYVGYFCKRLIAYQHDYLNILLT